MPRQNRPVVRGGRLQTPKKRTDRSYLGTPAAPPIDDAEVAVAAMAPPPVSSGAAASPASRSRVGDPGTQEVRRRRRDVNPEELLAQDSSYALHELRRVGILAAMVLATLIALGVFMR